MKRNPIAKALASAHLKPQIVPNKKAYKRKPKHAKRGEDSQSNIETKGRNSALWRILRRILQHLFGRFGLLMAFCLPIFIAACSAPKSNTPKNCSAVKFENKSFAVCKFNLKTESIALYLKAKDGTPYGDFGRLKDTLAQENKKLTFAMNAGMYHENRSPVGLYVENGIKTGRLQKRASNDNFGLLPNGVFWIDGAEADISETLEFEKRFDKNPLPRFVTQSGPMLVINGKLHKAFKPDSTSFNIRNGVGINADKSEIIFAISDDRVSFHQFARLFRDELKTPNALYLDGSISRLYSIDLHREDQGAMMGPIVAVTSSVK